MGVHVAFIPVACSVEARCSAVPNIAAFTEGFMTDSLSYYRDRQVVVTGCSSGMGAASAKLLRAAGATVIGLDFREPTDGVDVFHQVDLSDADSVRSIASRLQGPIWALFNCAGISNAAAEAPQVVRVNFVGLRELTEALIPLIPEGGAIASVASAAGQAYADNADTVIGLVRSNGFIGAQTWLTDNESYVQGRGGYTVSKEAVVLYTLDRCLDLAARGVRANVVGPGVTDTPFLLESAKQFGGMEFFENMNMVLGRWATAEDQANILAYLNSDKASYINGQVIWSDGGPISRRSVATVLDR
jgi:NAD(P)-dependent dehydrogenase (short-subunit alcohol dehydrogenase family)